MADCLMNREVVQLEQQLEPLTRLNHQNLTTPKGFIKENLGLIVRGFLFVSPNETVCLFVFAEATVGDITVGISITSRLSRGWKLNNNLARVWVDALDCFGLCLSHPLYCSSPVGILFRRTVLKIRVMVRCLDLVQVIDLGLMLWVIVGFEERFGNQAMNLMSLTLSVFVKLNIQVPTLAFRCPQNLSSYQTFHSPHTGDLVKSLISLNWRPYFIR